MGPWRLLYVLRDIGTLYCVPPTPATAKVPRWRERLYCSHGQASTGQKMQLGSLRRRLCVSDTLSTYQNYLKGLRITDCQAPLPDFSSRRGSNELTSEGLPGAAGAASSGTPDVAGPLRYSECGPGPVASVSAGSV